MSKADTLIKRYLSGTNTQAGADTFNQAQIDTALLPENGVVYRVNSIDIEFPGTFNNISADCWIRWSITRDTKTAAGALNDPDTVYLNGFSWALTTSGGALVPTVFRERQLEGLYIVEPVIYIQLQSASTGVANSANWRIYYDEVKMSEVDILRILANQG